VPVSCSNSAAVAYFYDNGTLLGTANWNGANTTASLTVNSLAVGTHSISVTDPYPGNTSCSAPVSVQITQAITQAVQVSGYINPKYIVLGVYYVTPGASSFSQYCNNTTIGTTNSITETFSSSYTKSLSVKLSEKIFGVAGGSTSLNYSSTYAQSNSKGNEVDISASTSTCLSFLGPTNWYEPNNHDYDLIAVWVNPVALLTFLEDGNGNVLGIQWNGYGFNQLDQPVMDVQYIYAGCLNSDFPTGPGTSCATNLAPLQRTWDNDEEWAPGDGPALTSQDLATILSYDPFGMCTPNADISPSSYPADNCSIALNTGEFTITDNQAIPYEQPIPGAGQNTKTYTLQYTVSNQESRDYTVSHSTTFGLEREWVGDHFGIGIDVTTGISHTYGTETETKQSLTTQNQQSAEASVTDPLCTDMNGICNPQYPSPAYPGPIQFDLYEDTLYGTFLYYPAPGYWYY